jgi:hypothetical protein
MTQAEFNAWQASLTKENIVMSSTPTPITLTSPGNTPATADTTPVSAGLTDLLSVLPATVVKALANVVAACHKEAAFVMGVLAAFDVVPTTNATTDHIGAILLLGYGSIIHAANAIGAKKAA